MNKFITGLLAVLMIASTVTTPVQAADAVSSATEKKSESTTSSTPVKAPTPSTKVSAPPIKTPPTPTKTPAPTTKAPATPTQSTKAPATPVKATAATKPVVTAPPAQSQQKNYEDGIYRGTYSDSNEMQVGLEFEIKGNKVVSIKFRHLMYKGKDYKAEKEDQTVLTLTKQYNSLLTHLVGKDIRTSLKDLYKPGEIVKESGVDGVSGATLRSGKLISAVNDGLNRGVYSYPSTK